MCLKLPVDTGPDISLPTPLNPVDAYISPLFVLEFVSYEVSFSSALAIGPFASDGLSIVSWSRLIVLSARREDKWLGCGLFGPFYR